MYTYVYTYFSKAIHFVEYPLILNFDHFPKTIGSAEELQFLADMLQERRKEVDILREDARLDKQEIRFTDPPKKEEHLGTKQPQTYQLAGCYVSTEVKFSAILEIGPFKLKVVFWITDL